MKKKHKNQLLFSLLVLALFIVFTISVRIIDVKPIGAQNTNIGFAKFNVLVHTLTGVNMNLYTITDWLGLIPIAMMLLFALIGLIQWFKRKRILNVDFNILLLGLFYIIVTVTFLFFESVIINFRPILINGMLEASYPSSTTMLVMCIMPTATLQIKKYIKHKTLRNILIVIIYIFTLFMVFGRLFSGVHWATDIIGGALFSISLVTAYYSLCNLKL